MQMNDPYDTSTPKYSTAQSIYDALCELTTTEEMSILSEMFSDVSYEGQDYYYTDKGYLLKERFEECSDYGNKMWFLDLAIWQLDQTEIHDTIWEALHNPDLAKRLGFKKLFIEKMLRGDKSLYDQIIEEYAAELSDCNRFDNWEMIKAFSRVLQARGYSVIETPYPTFAYYVCEKARNLHLSKETQLITECRALLTSYDDFILGMRMNQALHDGLEQLHSRKMAELQAAYNQKVKQLLMYAESLGIELPSADITKMLVCGISEPGIVTSEVTDDVSG